MQVPLAQAVVAAGRVEDIGLELGADGLIAREGHGERGGSTLIASDRENWEKNCKDHNEIYRKRYDAYMKETREKTVKLQRSSCILNEV